MCWAMDQSWTPKDFSSLTANTQLSSFRLQPATVGPRYSVFVSPTTNYFPTCEFQARSQHPTSRSPFRVTAPCVSTTSVKMSHAELATSYAALILADDGIEITVRTRLGASCCNCTGFLKMRLPGQRANSPNLVRQDPDPHQGRQRRRC